MRLFGTLVLMSLVSNAPITYRTVLTPNNDRASFTQHTAHTRLLPVHEYIGFSA